MSKFKKGNKPNQSVVKLLESLKMPIYDNEHNLFIYFRAKARSNETGIEHVAKTYHGLRLSDIEMIVKTINKPLLFKKDKNHKYVYNYYFKRKVDKKNAIKMSVLVDIKNHRKAEILTIFITSKIK